MAAAPAYQLRSHYQIPKPVDDATQNYGLNGEYVGTSPWGQRFVFKVGYNGSQYTDNYSAYTVQLPTSRGGTAFESNFDVAEQSGQWP